MWKVFFHNRNFHKLEVSDEKPNGKEIKVIPKYIGICGTDKNIYIGRKKVREPLVLGHEIAGVTEDGSKVVVFPNYWCNSCKNCKRGLYNSCVNKISIGVNADGGMAEWINVPKGYIFYLPKDLDLKLGALVEPTAVGLSAIKKINNDDISNVIIIGGGSTGSLTAIISEILGFKPIIIEKDLRKVERLKDKGFLVLTNIDSILEEQIAVIDTVNNAESVSLALKILENSVARSQYIITGLDEENIVLNRDVLVRNEIEVKGSIIYTPAAFKESIKIISNNRDKFAKIIDRIGNIEDINNWFREYVIEEPNVKVLVSLS
ncbi:zinc-dependent alcohol dehydrogenase [Saccharolobus caldissimus]|uniref:Butanediol dehydrogenase n=1 Tax=Saccharolobus caldissimus TaxID=1702097 RepID=A0AAQ4CUC1_9CREN|nr:medium chain dehydrogenase/reductase family protein [Saccharolobus caldissimus]BDB99402.1 butanediol dehydrogenase [Saccharolobus caldissimus]